MTQNFSGASNPYSRYPHNINVTALSQIASVMAFSAQLFAAMCVSHSDGEEADANGDVNEISHAVASPGFDSKPRHAENVVLAYSRCRKSNSKTHQEFIKNGDPPASQAPRAAPLRKIGLA